MTEQTSPPPPGSQFSTPTSSPPTGTAEAGSSSGSSPETSSPSGSPPSGGDLNKKTEERLASFEARLEEIQAEVDAVLPGLRAKANALLTELEKGGLVSRLHELELAVASLAAPQLSQNAHDSHGLLTEWFDRFRHVFFRAAEAPPAGSGTDDSKSLSPAFEERNAVLGSPSPSAPPNPR